MGLNLQNLVKPNPHPLILNCTPDFLDSLTARGTALAFFRIHSELKLPISFRKTNNSISLFFQFHQEMAFLSATMISSKMMILLFIYVIHCNADHEENGTDPMNSNQLLSGTSFHKYKRDDEITALNASMLRSPDPIITRTQVAIGTFSMIISNSFSLVVLGYLANISLAKDCLLLYLYKDLIRLGICLNCIGEISQVLIYSIEDGTGIPGTGAKMLSFLALNILLLMSLSINAITTMKL